MSFAELDNRNKTLYLFLDESGNYDFSPNGTKYLTFTCLSTEEPTQCVIDLYNLKHNLIEQHIVSENYSLEYFHATEDRQFVRDEVFKLIGRCKNFTVDSIIVEKSKTNPKIRDILILYPKIYGYLLKYVFRRYLADSFQQLIIFTDRIGVKKKRQAVEKALKMSIKEYVPREKHHTILHHESKSHFYLQIVDYCSWAIYVKWDRKEERPFKAIKDKVKSEFEIFKRGTKHYY